MMNYPCFYNQVSMYNPNKKGNIKTNGTGTIIVDPDVAYINIGIITEDKNLNYAKEENAKITNSVIDSLYKIDIPKTNISTSYYYIEQQYSYVSGKQVFTDYKVTNTLTVKVTDLTKVSEVIDAAVKSGANSISNIRFTIADSSKYYNQALNKALNNAFLKAQNIANHLRVRLIPTPYSVTESSYNSIVEESASLKVSVTPTPVIPGQISITAQLEAVFLYK